MLTLQIGALPLQVYFFAAILGLFLTFFVVAFLARGLLLRFRLARLIKQIHRVGSEGGELAPLFEKDKALRHLWEEFHKTLHQQKELNPKTGQFEIIALRPTVPAEMFFNSQSLVDNRLRTEFFKHLPGIFTGVGIIGTFLGLILGLQAFKVSETPTVVRESLNSLLHGVWEAFLVSALAISLAMVVTVIEKLLLASLYHKVEELNQALESQLQAGAGEEYLSRLVKASEESATQTKILKDALVADLKQVLSDLTERQIAAQTAGNAVLGQAIGAHIQASLQKPLEDIARATGGLREDQGSAVTKLLTDVMAGFSQRLQDLFGGQINGINQLQQQTIQALQAAVVRLEQMASEIQSSGTKATDAMAERLSEAMSSMEARQSVMNGQMGEFLQQLRQMTRETQSESHQKLTETLEALGSKVEGVVATLQAQSNEAAIAHFQREERATQRAEQSIAQLGGKVDTVLEAVAKASTEMANSVTALREVTTDSINRMNSGAETLYVASSDFAKAGQGVTGVLTQATTVSGQLAQAAGSVVSATRSMDGALADYRATRDVVAKMISELTSTVEAAKREATLTADILHRIDSAATKLTHAQTLADDYLGKISEVLTEAHQSFTRNLQQSLTTANSDFHIELSRATKMLGDSIKELELTLGDAAVRS